MRTRPASTVYAVAIALLMFLIASTPLIARAQTPTTDNTDTLAFEFYPADKGFGEYFSAEIKAGQSTTLTALLANRASVPQDLRTLAINAFTAPGGGFAAAEDGTPPNAVTQWLDFPEQVTTVAPGTGVKLDFRVSVPEGTPPGQYLTAVVAERANAVSGTSSITQVLRYAVPVFITVPGETTSGFSVGTVQLTARPEGIEIDIPIENTGDVRVRPKGDVAILGEDGKRIASFPVEMQSVYAHDQTTLTISAPGNFPTGKYSVTVSLKDEETGTTAEGGVKDVQLAGTGTEAVQSPVTLGQSTIEPGPSKDNVQFVTVSTIVSNSGDPIANGQLSLIAKKDGKEVERFPISQSLSVPTGDTPVSTRYIPAEGFTTGTWTFELLLETTDGSGAALVLAQQPIDGQVVIP